MKFLVLYLIRSLAISFGVGLVSAYSLMMLPVPGRRGSEDRIALGVGLAIVFFVLQIVTMPYLVYRRGGCVTVEEIHNEQLRIFTNVKAFFRRHRALIIGAFIGVLIALVLVDSFKS